MAPISRMWTRIGQTPCTIVELRGQWMRRRMGTTVDLGAEVRDANHNYGWCRYAFA